MLVEEYGEFQILKYRALNGTYYYCTFVNNMFKFVHISRKKISTCTIGKSKKGTKCLYYKGGYFLLPNGTIEIK